MTRKRGALEVVTVLLDVLGIVLAEPLPPRHLLHLPPPLENPQTLSQTTENLRLPFPAAEEARLSTAQQ